MVSPAQTQLMTQPPNLGVTRAEIATWSVDFTLLLNPGETIEGAAVTLVETTPPTLAVIAGFATAIDLSGSVVLVTWTGDVLTEGSIYRMETDAVLNTGDVVPLLTQSVCVAG
jgi:hypothetical protein